MDNSRILESKPRHTDSSILKGLKFGLVWLAIATGFTVVGFFEASGRGAAEGALLFGAWGVGAATCFTAHIWTLGRVRNGSLGRSSAVLWLLAGSIIGAGLTPLVIRLEQAVLPGEFLRGEDHWAALYIEGLMLVTASGALVLFLPLVLLISRRRASSSIGPGR